MVSEEGSSLAGLEGLRGISQCHPARAPSVRDNLGMVSLHKKYLQGCSPGEKECPGTVRGVGPPALFWGPLQGAGEPCFSLILTPSCLSTTRVLPCRTKATKPQCCGEGPTQVAPSGWLCPWCLFSCSVLLALSCSVAVCY